jgi:hypothetical protein
MRYKNWIKNICLSKYSFFIAFQFNGRNLVKSKHVVIALHNLTVHSNVQMVLLCVCEFKSVVKNKCNVGFIEF